MRLFLFRVLGWRISVQFGCISLIFAAILSALYLTSGYALQSYVNDQLDRIPWDVSAGQRDAVRYYPAFQKQLRSLKGTKRVEAFGLLRLINPGVPVQVELNGKAMPVRWLVVVGSSTPELLPRQLQLSGEPANGRLPAAVLDVRDPVTGSSSFSAGKLRLRKTGLVREEGHHHADDSGPSFAVTASSPDYLFEAAIERPIALERDEFNKWLLRTVGSTSYLPGESIVVAVPMKRFAELADLFDRSFGASSGMHGGSAAPPYIPELTHLIRLDRNEWIEPWLFVPTLDRLTNLQDEVLRSLQELTIFSYVSSDTFGTLLRMSQVSKIVGAVTLLLAVPLLWLGWAVANMLGRLLLLNERRLMGLVLIRGAAPATIGRVLIASLVIGGVVGGLLGLGIGISLTILGHSLAGHPAPPASVLFSGAAYYLIFAMVGVGVTLLSASSMIRRVRQMSPREATSYISSSEVEAASGRAGTAYFVACTIALLLGLLKLVDWTTGWSLFSALSADEPGTISAALQLFSGLLNFLAVPLFLFGICGLLGSRLKGVEHVLSAMAAPIAGRLRWFVAEHMATNRQRVAGTLFISSLAMSLALLPQVTADSFYDRMARGIATSVGGDIQLEYEMAKLSGRRSPELVTFGAAERDTSQALGTLEKQLRGHPAVQSVAVMYQMLAPDIYVPNQSGLFVNIIRSPAEYIRTTNFEDGLGFTGRFRDIVSGGAPSELVASAGFLRLRQVPLGQPVLIGSSTHGPVAARFRNVLGFLPGQPTVDVSQREGYAPAEVEYLNYMLATDARAVATAQSFRGRTLDRLLLQPSKVVLLVRLKDRDSENEATIEDIVRHLSMRPEAARWQARERRLASRDMFISLALANLKVFMIGGLILSVAGISVIGLANFLAERRTFALLRLRGFPLATLIRVSLSIFLAPVAAGVVVGALLSLIAGYGLSIAVWQLPRVYGVAGLLSNKLAISPAAGAILVGSSLVLLLVALGFALWPFRRTANENIRKS